MKNEKYLIGRLVRFSYLIGSKRERQYVADYVHISKDSHKSIGCFTIWFQATRLEEFKIKDAISFKPLDNAFTPGYLSMENYAATISNSILIDAGALPFAIPTESMQKLLPQWSTKLTFDII